jgi:hypothetical protein
MVPALLTRGHGLAQSHVAEEGNACPAGQQLSEQGWHVLHTACAQHTCVHFSMSFGYFSTAVMQMSMASSRISAVMSVYLTKGYLACKQVCQRVVHVATCKLTTVSETDECWAHLPIERFHVHWMHSFSHFWLR